MSRLLDDLLDVSRTTRGTLILRRSTVDLAAVVAAAQESARPLIESRGHTLVVRLPETLRLMADPKRLQQVVWGTSSRMPSSSRTTAAPSCWST